MKLFLPPHYLSLLIGIAHITTSANAADVASPSRGLRASAASADVPRSLASRCGGCSDCTDDVWNKPVHDYNGEFSCGARIEWVTDNVPGIASQRDACINVAANEFAVECGKACNPYRCDGRNDPYEVKHPDPTPVQPGDLVEDANLYCFVPHAARQRYTNVWDNNFVMEVKESATGGICEPGANHFSNQAVAFDANSQELTLEFKKQGGRWMGSEVRLLSTDMDNAPFHYGTYEWSLKSVKILNANTMQEVSPPRPLPPRLTIGLFSWDTTEDFAIRENRNHEVDIEIGQFGEIGGPDVNFLVQPPHKPQHGKFYSGGADSTSYDQSGYKWKFEWSPNQIEWSTNAGGGLSHLYSADIIKEYYAPAWLQCLPADVEMRMNLWSLDGIGDQLDLADNEMVQVIIDDFSYTPSGETGVPDGGSCVKDCQCSSMHCDDGICGPDTYSGGGGGGGGGTTTDASTIGIATTDATTEENPFMPQSDSSCAANAGCVALGHATGDCCPTPDGTNLWCCSEEVEGGGGGDVAPPSANGNAACSAHSSCAGLVGDCCPTPAGTTLGCCDTEEDGPVQEEEGGGGGAACSANPGCAGLAGDCCPTPVGTNLSCCGGEQEEVAPVQDAACSANPGCVAEGHSIGACCPTPDGTTLWCCTPSDPQAACSANPSCAALGHTSGTCCPTVDGVHLGCCD